MLCAYVVKYQKHLFCGLSSNCHEIVSNAFKFSFSLYNAGAILIFNKN